MRRMMGSRPMERDNDGSAVTASARCGRRAGVSDAASGEAPVQPDAADVAAAPTAARRWSTSCSRSSRTSCARRSPRSRARRARCCGTARRSEPATARQLLQDIDQEADRLHRLVDNLLELARAGVGAVGAQAPSRRRWTCCSGASSPMQRRAPATGGCGCALRPTCPSRRSIRSGSSRSSATWSTTP